MTLKICFRMISMLQALLVSLERLILYAQHGSTRAVKILQVLNVVFHLLAGFAGPKYNSFRNSLKNIACGIAEQNYYRCNGVSLHFRHRRQSNDPVVYFNDRLQRNWPFVPRMQAFKKACDVVARTQVRSMFAYNTYQLALDCGR